MSSEVAEFVTVYELRQRDLQASHPLVYNEVEAGRAVDGQTSGTIVDVYWASMGDWPEFVLEDAHGERSAWGCYGDPRRYVTGLRARLSWVETELRLPASLSVLSGPSKTLTRVELEPSTARSSGVQIGPGGSGWALAGGPRTRIHYLACPSRNTVRELRDALGTDVTIENYLFETDEIWIKVTGGTPDRVAQAAEAIGATYDGCEVLRVPGPPDVHGPPTH